MKRQSLTSKICKRIRTSSPSSIYFRPALPSGPEKNRTLDSKLLGSATWLHPIRKSTLIQMRRTTKLWLLTWFTIFVDFSLSHFQSTVSPYISGPNDVKTMTSVRELEKRNVPIQKVDHGWFHDSFSSQAYIVSCVNSRYSDLLAAAEVLKGKKVKEGVQLYVAAASSNGISLPPPPRITLH